MSSIASFVNLVITVLSLAIVGRALLSWFDPGMKTMVGRLLRDRPHQTQARPDQVLRRRHRPREPDCPRRSSLPGIPETAWSDRDRPPQRSASSDPPANRTRILSRESKQAMRFYTGWVIFDRGSELCRPVHFRFAPKADFRCLMRNWSRWAQAV